MPRRPRSRRASTAPVRYQRKLSCCRPLKVEIYPSCRPASVRTFNPSHVINELRIAQAKLMIARRSLPAQLVPLLCDLIIEGELVPGTRIHELALCARLGVSRTPVREALKMLSVKGLVRLSPNQGAIVVCMTRGEVEDLIPLLATIEGHAGELACARIDAAALARITDLHRRSLDDHDRGDEQAYLRTNRAFHGAIVAAAGSRRLCEVHDFVDTQLCLLSVSRKLSPQWDEAVEDHEQMVEALRARDGSRLAVLMREHVRHKTTVIRAAFDAELPA